MNMILKIWGENSRKPTTKLYNDRTRRWNKSVVPNSFKKAYVKVSYGNKQCNEGCLCEFYNDGEYQSKHDLLFAIEMFREGSKNGNG